MVGQLGVLQPALSSRSVASTHPSPQWHVDPRGSRPGVQHRLLHAHQSRHAPSAAAVEAETSGRGGDAPPGSSVPPTQAAKRRLLDAVAGTQRGSEAGALKRGEIEEAQVALEALAGVTVDWELLEGTWRLIYTTAPDVLPLVRPGGGLPGLQVGRVAQRFSSPQEGRVQNIIDVQATGPFVEWGRARLVVEASYELRTAHSIALRFRQAGVSQVQLGSGLQNLLAPALLPRGWWNQRVLLALQEASLQVPLSTRVPGVSSSSRQAVGINYALTYLDGEVLVGRAQGSGGTYMFVREETTT